MRTFHRILAIVFGRSRSPIASSHLAGNLGAVCRQVVGSDVLTCTAWAGLYVEDMDVGQNLATAPSLAVMGNTTTRQTVESSRRPLPTARIHEP